MTVRNWSTTPGSNNSAVPNGAPEGMAPSGVNNVIRQIMAETRDTFEQLPYFDYGHTPTRVDADTLTVPTDLTATYYAGRRIKLVGATTGYATIASSSYSAPDTTVNVTMDNGNVPTSLNTVSIGFDTTNAPTLSTAIKYDITPAETAAGADESELYTWYAHDDIRRYKVVADGVTSQSTKIHLAMDALESAGGGKLRIPFMTGLGIAITDTVQPYDNVTIEWEGEFFKVISDTTYDAAVTPIPGARNVTLINPLIDCNSVAAQCGIIARRNNTDMTVIGGTVKNAVHDTTDKGGRALNVEAGVNDATEGPRNLRVFGLLASNCYEACSVSGGAYGTQEESNIRIDMIARNCESLLSLFGNSAGYPHDVREMGMQITMTARNCGKASTYSRVHGVVNSDRGCNATIHVKCDNDATYGAVGSFWRGDAANIKFTGEMSGECSRALLDFASYQEANSIDEDATYTGSGNTLSTLNSDFDVKHSGTIADTVLLPISGADFLKNTRIKLVTDVVTTLAPLSANMRNKADVYVWMQNKTSNAIIEGYCPDIYSATFAQAANIKYDASKQGQKCWATFSGATGTVNRSFNITSVTRVSTGVYDVLWSVKPPNGITSVMIAIQSQASSASNQVDDYSNITNDGFRITTYSGGAIADKALVSFSVSW